MRTRNEKRKTPDAQTINFLQKKPRKETPKKTDSDVQKNSVVVPSNECGAEEIVEDVGLGL